MNRSLLILFVALFGLPFFGNSTLTLEAKKPADRMWHELSELTMDQVDPRRELTTVVLKIGPFGPLGPHLPGSDSQSGPSSDFPAVLERPAVNDTIEIAFWGEWVLVDANGTEIPRRELYLHHILAYTNGEFITGCSSERTSWGVDHLPYPYRQVLSPHQEVRPMGFHFNNMANKDVKFWVRYKIMYKIHNPMDPPIRVVRSFYWMDNFNVPGGSPVGAMHTRNKSVRVPKKMVIISTNGHMHQGGMQLILRIKETGQELCVSRNLYHESEMCYWDCPDICPYKPHGWTAQWGTSTCYMEYPITSSVELESSAIYDNSCAWRGVMAWWFNFGWDGEMLPKSS